MTSHNDPPEAGTTDVPERLYDNAPDIGGDDPDDWHTHSPDWMDW